MNSSIPALSPVRYFDSAAIVEYWVLYRVKEPLPDTAVQGQIYFCGINLVKPDNVQSVLGFTALL